MKEVSCLCALLMYGREQLNKHVQTCTVFWEIECCLLVERMEKIPEEKLLLVYEIYKAVGLSNLRHQY